MATGSGASVEYVIEALRIFDEGTSSSVDEDSEPKLLPHDAPHVAGRPQLQAQGSQLLAQPLQLAPPAEPQSNDANRS